MIRIRVRRTACRVRASVVEVVVAVVVVGRDGRGAVLVHVGVPWG